MPPKRMTANPVKAPRYRPGKAIAEDNSSSGSEGSDDEPETVSQPPPKPTPKFTNAGSISSNLSKVDLNGRRKKAAINEKARIAEEQAQRAKEEEEFVTEESEEGSEDESEDGIENDEEEECEKEAPRRVMMRPMFIKKGKRKELGVVVAKALPEAEQLAEEARRKAVADEIVEEQIQKDLAAKATGKKHWDDDENEGDDVDDTDDLDPEAELAAWKLRELKRIKRDREAIEEREREREEIERRKNLTEEERKAEDDAFLAKQKEEKEGKVKMSYMQKYFHKGAFFQDDLKAEGLNRRDIMGSRFADDMQNREILPQALQMRDMTKLGKKGATKYKDLKAEDTGRWGQFDDRKPRQGQGGFVADERFMPDRGGGGSGANNQPVAERKRPDKIVGAPEGPRAMREGGDRYRDGGTYQPNNGSRPRSRSRSMSPRRGGYHNRSRRKRSSSRDRDLYESDKRRRVDSR